MATNNAEILMDIIQIASQVQDNQSSSSSSTSSSDDQIFHAVDKALQKALQHKLFTILAYDAHAALLTRVYSTREDINPIGGRKRVNAESPWTRRVLREGAVLLASDLRAMFADYEVLWGIGCRCVLNVPVRFDNVTLGTLNLLHEEGKYDDDGLVGVVVLVAQLLVPILSAKVAELAGREVDDEKLVQV